MKITSRKSPNHGLRESVPQTMARVQHNHPQGKSYPRVQHITLGKSISFSTSKLRVPPHPFPKMPPKNYRRPQNKKKKPPQPRFYPVFGPTNRPKPKPKKRAKAAGAGSSAAKYAQMVANPFTANLCHGMFGEVATGMSQFKKSYSFGIGTTGLITNDSGFILWWPGGNSSGFLAGDASTRDQPVGVMMMKGQSSSTLWNNTAANKAFGTDYLTWSASATSSSSSNTTSVETPDNFFLSSIAARSKLLSAGMVMRCTANPLLMQGEYIKIDGLPMSELLEPSVATQALHVDRLFDLSAHEPRPFKAGNVVRHVYLNDRHNVGLSTDCSDQSTDNSDPSAVNVNTGNSKTCLAIQNRGSSEATLPTAYNESHSPRVFGIAFRGISPDMLRQLYVDCYVSKEYTVSATNGIPNAIAARSGPDLSEAAHLMASLKVSAFNAVENGVGDLAKGLINKGVKSFGADVLGLL